MRTRTFFVGLGAVALGPGCGDDGTLADGSGSSSGAVVSTSLAVSSTSGVDTTAAVPSSSSGESSSSSAGLESGASSDSSSSAAGSSDSTTGDQTTGSTGDPPSDCEPTNPDGKMVCGDGTVVAGELCYETGPLLQDAGTFATRVWAGDLDDDGDPDALALVSFPVAMTVFLNGGAGNLVFDDTYTLAMGQDTGANDVDAGDMDSDTWVDAVVAFASPPSVLVLCNDGGGAFGFPIVTGLAQEPNAIAVADIDGDFNNDVILVDDTAVRLLYGLGDGTFGVVDARVDPALVGGRDVDVADFDGDGDLDVAVAFSQTVAVFPNELGTLGAPTTVPVTTSALGPDDLDIGDVTGDGELDIVVADDFSSTIQILAGAGDNTFTPDPMPLEGSYVVVGDANADCSDDIYSRTTPLMFDELTLYPSDGMGGVRPATNFLLHSGMVDMDGADFNGDTLTDLLFGIGPLGEIGVSMSQP